MIELRSVPSSEAWKALAVIRCGDNSLHQSWAEGDRKFDVAVSYFGSDSERCFPEARYLHRFKGGKWNGIFDFFAQYPETLEQYDLFWFPDDDIQATAKDIDALVELGRIEQLDVFQPALDQQSYYSHLITLRHPSFTMRYTNFVEIMVPFVSKRLLTETLPMLKDSRSGFGMDFVWPEVAARVSKSPFSAAIIDKVSVRHTRPVGGSLHQLMSRSGGPSTLDELGIALDGASGRRRSLINGVPVPRVDILCGRKSNGKTVKGVPLAAMVAADMLLLQTNSVQPIAPNFAMRHALKCAIRG